MTNPDNDRKDMDAVLGVHLNSDVPPEVETRLRSRLAQFRARLDTRHAGHAARLIAALRTRPLARAGGIAAAAAVLIAAVLILRPAPTVPGWAAAGLSLSSTAWAEEAAAALRSVKSVTCSERYARVLASGKRILFDDVCTFSVAHNCSRLDQYNSAGTLIMTQWYTPAGQTDVDYVKRTYRVKPPYNWGDGDPVQRMSFLVRWLPKADRVLGVEVIEGHQCVGFEISANKFGDNPATMKDRVWFDVQTRLPVRNEWEWEEKGFPGEFSIQTRDNYNWNVELSEDTFVPVIPGGFVKVSN